MPNSMVVGATPFMLFDRKGNEDGDEDRKSKWNRQLEMIIFDKVKFPSKNIYYNTDCIVNADLGVKFVS